MFLLNPVGNREETPVPLKGRLVFPNREQFLVCLNVEPRGRFDIDAGLDDDIGMPEGANRR